MAVDQDNSTSVNDYDVFVSYYEDGADDLAERVYKVLKERGYKVFVAHIIRPLIEGDFEKVVDSVIKTCKIVILLNTVGSLERSQVIREMKTAFPDGKINDHEFWPYRNIRDVQNLDEFKNKTRLELAKINQPYFSNAGDLARLLITRCESKRQYPKQESSVQNAPANLLPLKLKTKTSAVNIVHEQKQIDTEIENKNYTKALEFYDQLLVHDPMSAELLNNKGIVYGMNDQLKDAQEYFELALSVSKNSPVILSNLALSLHRQNKNTEAMEIITRSLKIKKEPNSLLIKANILFSLKRYVEAIKLYDEIVPMMKNPSLIYSSKASAFEKLGDKKNALYYLKKALESDSANDNAWYNYGVILQSEKKFEDALQCYDKSLFNNKHNILSWNNRGVILRLLGRYEESLQNYDEAIRLNPKYANPYSNKGLALSYLGRYEESLPYFDKALSIDNKIETYINKSVSQTRLERYVDSLSTLEEALQLDENNAQALSNKVYVLRKLNRDDEADLILRKMLVLGYDVMTTILDLSSSLIRQKKYNDALELVNEGLLKNQNQVNLLLLKSTALINLKQYELGDAECDKILQLDVFNGGAYYNKACIKSLKNDKRNAVDLLQKAVSLDPNIVTHIENESDFENIKHEPEFKKLLESGRSKNN